MATTRSESLAKWQPSAKATPAISFLDLPRELRDMIYRFALTSKVEIDLAGIHVCDSWSGLMTTCRQLHVEATPLFYELNEFWFKVDEVLTKDTISSIMDRKFPPRYQSRIQKLHLLYLHSHSIHTLPRAIVLESVTACNFLISSGAMPNLKHFRVAVKPTDDKTWKQWDYSLRDWNEGRWIYDRSTVRNWMRQEFLRSKVRIPSCFALSGPFHVNPHHPMPIDMLGSALEALKAEQEAFQQGETLTEADVPFLSGESAI